VVSSTNHAHTHTRTHAHTHTRTHAHTHTRTHAHTHTRTHAPAPAPIPPTPAARPTAPVLLAGRDQPNAACSHPSAAHQPQPKYLTSV
jgi:hypothetical protein